MNDTRPIALVIFGVTGDLTQRKLIPALYELQLSGRLPQSLHVIGFARRDWDDAALDSVLRKGVNAYAHTKPVDENALNQLMARAHYIQSTFDNPAGYDTLCGYLQSQGINDVLFYLATPPDSYLEILRHLGECGLARPHDGFSRVIIEKPYGSDLQSAKALDEAVHAVFNESQVYRIDHYLGKETVQNILVLRFANGIFEPLWNRRYIDSVQITVAETVGVETRANYYETAGVIRDVFQNHLLQLLTLTAMEAPVAFNADTVRDEKLKVLKALRPMADPAEVMRNTLRGQYVGGEIDGQRVPGYRDEPGVAHNSVTETYLAARLFVDSWRWSGVPFYLRSGKRMPRRLTEIVIQFKQVPLSLFGTRNLAGDAPNMLILNIQPDEGITLTFGAKQPGPEMTIKPVQLTFSLAQAFGGEPPEAYERLLLDGMQGDATLFTRSDEVQAAWAFVDDTVDAWKGNAVKNLPVYESGTWGPAAADEFITRDGRAWHNPE
jgi:glucose-6-phosphate 1-dehydrogenase